MVREVRNMINEGNRELAEFNFVLALQLGEIEGSNSPYDNGKILDRDALGDLEQLAL